MNCKRLTKDKIIELLEKEQLRAHKLETLLAASTANPESWNNEQLCNELARRTTDEDADVNELIDATFTKEQVGIYVAEHMLFKHIEEHLVCVCDFFKGANDSYLQDILEMFTAEEMRKTLKSRRELHKVIDTDKTGELKEFLQDILGLSRFEPIDNLLTTLKEKL